VLLALVLRAFWVTRVLHAAAWFGRVARMMMVIVMLATASVLMKKKK
jgi:hypothetical protein